MKKEITFCDVCGEEKQIKTINIDVIFHTDQTEGRYSEPYLSREKIDICEHCYITIIRTGKYLHGSGAQGYNNFRFE